MKLNYSKVFVIILGMFCLMFGLAFNANGQISGDCQNCHGSTIDDFSLETPNPTETCVDCHGAIDSYHAYPKWVSQYVYGGYFKNEQSVQTGAPEIHLYHNGANAWATDSYCGNCHRPASCQSCHAIVPHQQHSSTQYSFPTYVVADGMNDTSQTLSCATSECHKFYNNGGIIRVNPDGTELCMNCHSTDTSGHSEEDLATKHTTTFNQTLISESDTESINCSNCHNSELRTEHYNNSTDCNACHGDTTPLEVKAVIDSANGVEANRACEKCHFNMNVLPTRAPSHPLDHIATESNNLDVTGGPHPTCNTCHDRTGILDTIKSLAYSSPKDYSCFTCHTGIDSDPAAPLHQADYNGQQMAIMDVHTSCASCHTKGTDYAVTVENVIAKLNDPVNPVSGYSCEECHTDLSSGHTATFEGITYNDTTSFHLACTDCHNAENKSTVASLKEQVKLGLTYDCSACHMVANTEGVSPYYPVHNAEGDEVVGFHPQSCETCHGVVNETYNINLDSIRTQLPTPGYACNDCHNGTVTQRGVVADEPYHQAKDADGLVYITTDFHPSCATCHDSTDTNVEEIIATKAGTTTPYNCSDCHIGGLAPVHNADWNDGTAYETTQFHDNCAQCHSSENGDVDAKISAINADLGSGTITKYNCADCHNNTVAPDAQHSAKLNADDAVSQDTTQYHLKLTVNESESCFQCHGNSLVDADIDTIFTKVEGGNGYLCTDCHNNGTSEPYTPNHSAVLGSETLDTTAEHPNCTTCHTTTADDNIRNLKGQFGYTCETCHTNLTEKHQSATDLTSTMNMVNCSWCHSSSEAEFATNNLIGIHVKPNITLSQEYECNVCHGSTSPVKTQIANNQTACNSCHDGVSAPIKHPDSQYYPRHIEDPFPIFMEEYSPNCGTCHTNNSIINLHSAENVGCTTCHFTEEYKPAVVSLDPDCTGCHTSTVNVAMDMEESHKPFHNADTTTYPDTTLCIDCHAIDTTVDGQSLLAVHKKDPNSTVTCDTCHGSTARQEAQDAVIANNVSCQACHGSVGHNHNVTADGYDSNPNVDCGTCHSTANDGTAELASIHQDAADRGLIPDYSCEVCHNDTFEDTVIAGDGLDMLNNGSPIYCTDCHDGTNADALGKKYPEHDGTHNAAVEFGEYKWESGVDCSKCHTNIEVAPTHDSATQDVTCNSCHTSSNTEVRTVIESNWSRAASPVGFTCADCHNTLATSQHDYEHEATGTDPVTCSTCHDGNTVVGVFNASNGTAVDVTGIHTSNNCNTCHTSTNLTVEGFINEKVGSINDIYTCDNCHDSITPKHDKMHTVTEFNSEGSTGCVRCHYADVTIQHSETFKAGLNCDTCHGVNAGAVLTNTPAVITANLSSNDSRTGYNCQDCHTNIEGGHNHNVTADGYDSNPNVDCGTCHSTATDGTAELASIHQDAADRGLISDYSCAVCHNDTFEDTIIAGDGLDMLNNGTPIYCTDCHDGTNADALGKKYPEHDGTHNAAVEFGEYKWESGVDCSKCHTNMEVAPVHDSATQDVTCNSCHTSSNAEVRTVIESNWSRAASPVGFTCADCHNTLAESQHDYEHEATGNDPVTCSTCHDGNTVVGVFNAPNGTAVDVTGIHTSNDCNTCHTSTNLTVEGFINEKVGSINDIYTCDNCHDSITPKHDKMHTVTEFNSEGSTGCVRCHYADVTIQHSETFKAGLNCDTCHGVNAGAVLTNTPAVITANLSSNYSRPGFTCEDCHPSPSHRGSRR